jgi:8-oxo-dGTP pyrophosphatase MutT (NUDIX family)
MTETSGTNPVSAGVVVVRREGNGWRALLLRAYQYWDFPKGLVEKNEKPLMAAIREVEEETTLTGLNFCWGEEYCQTAPYGRLRKIARYYIAESDEGDVDLPVSAELGRPEHEEFRWVSFDQAYELVSPRVSRVLDWAVRMLEEYSE